MNTLRIASPVSLEIVTEGRIVSRPGFEKEKAAKCPGIEGNGKICA